MENWFSRFALDIIGKAVFNYDFDSLSKDDPVIQAVYSTLREAEYRPAVALQSLQREGAAMLAGRSLLALGRALTRGRGAGALREGAGAAQARGLRTGPAPRDDGAPLTDAASKEAFMKR